MHISIGAAILILGVLFLGTFRGGRQVLLAVGGTLAVALAGAYYLLFVVPQVEQAAKTRELAKFASLSSIPLNGALDCTNEWGGLRTIVYDLTEGHATTLTEGGESKDTVTMDAEGVLHFSWSTFEDTMASDGVLVVRRAFGHEDNGPDGKPRVLARCVWRTATASAGKP